MRQARLWLARALRFPLHSTSNQSSTLYNTPPPPLHNICLELSSKISN